MNLLLSMTGAVTGAWFARGEVMVQSFALGLACAAVATALLAAVALRLRLVDRVGPGERERKEEAQSARTPVIGGMALAVSLFAVGLFAGRGWGTVDLSGLAVTACIGALLLGLADDTRKGGISAGTKLALQAVIALLLAFASPDVFTWAGAFALPLRVLFAIAALNVWNTWDHADGNAAGTGLFAFLFPAPAIAGACAGFLFFNLGPARRRPILGDAGSHLLAALCVLVPASWPLMTLPALDLSRVCWLRIRAGKAPWEGDRRHLAHRLQRRGLSRHAIFLWLAGVSALSLAGALGWIGTCLGFIALVALGEERVSSVSGSLAGSPRAVAERVPTAPPHEPEPPAAPAPVRPEPLRAQ